MNKRERKRIKKQMIELLEKTPIVLSVCSRVNIARSTFYRWKEEDLAFSNAIDEAIENGRSTINDLAVNQLIMNIKNNNMTAIIFWLKHNHRDFDNRPLRNQAVKPEPPLSPEMFAEMDAFVRRMEEEAIEAEVNSRLKMKSEKAGQESESS